MPRYLFRVEAHGGLTEDLKQIRIPKKDTMMNVVINCGSKNKAKKLARKQHDGTFWLLGTLDENDKFHILNKEES